jgi:transcriptional regulator with XRE-family HTH domain
MRKPTNREPPANSLESVGARLQKFRKHTGLSQTELCRQLNVWQNAWSMYEHGERPVPLSVAFKLSQPPWNLTADWIYWGKADGLSGKLARELEAYSDDDE